MVFHVIIVQIGIKPKSFLNFLLFEKKTYYYVSYINNGEILLWSGPPVALLIKLLKGMAS